MAARGWVSRDDALECGQGFWETQGPDHESFPVARQDNQPFQIQNNLFKYHAACYMTHSTIEACRARCARRTRLTPEAINRVRVRVAEQNLKVCNLSRIPATGPGESSSRTGTSRRWVCPASIPRRSGSIPT